MPDDKLPTPERVLVVAAHPDDIEFGAAGTVARWVGEGADVRYLLATRGDKGSDDPATDVAALAALREREQRAAAAEIGVDGVEFLDEPDGQVEPSLRLRERITHAIRAFRPEVVDDARPHRPVRQQRVGQPSGPPRGRPGRRSTPSSRPLAIRSTSREHLEAGLEAWKVAELFLWSTNEANQLVDIAGTHRAQDRRPARITPASSGRSTRSRDGSVAGARSSASAPATARRRASGG